MEIIKPCSLTSILPLRSLVLRPGLRLDQAILKQDKNKSILSRHFTLLDDDNVMACLSLYKSSNPLFNERKQWQLRAMAVAKVQNGFGTKLLNYALQCEEFKNSLIWCNIRKESKNFYVKTGFQVTGAPFLIKNIGLHFLASYKNGE